MSGCRRQGRPGSAASSTGLSGIALNELMRENGRRNTRRHHQPYSYLVKIPITCLTYHNRIRIIMIRSFKGKFAEPILPARKIPKGFPENLAKVARRKLIMVDSAGFLEALKSPPGNHLEALKGDLAGKHSIRINDQWRVVFQWTNMGPFDVEIVDYH
jgi:proteic killer suppression protein